jgi:hypothetical protein
MALAPLALVSDLAARAGEQILDDDARAGSVLSMASSLVRAYVGNDYADVAVPDAAVQVTVDVAYRVWSNPDGLVGDGIDDASRRWSESTASEGFYLTKANKIILDSLRTSRSNGGLWTLGVEKGDEYAGTVYVPTAPEPAGYPFPWYAADDPLIQP